MFAWLVPAFSKNFFCTMVKTGGNTHKATVLEDVAIHIDELHIDENKNLLEFLGQSRLSEMKMKPSVKKWMLHFENVRKEKEQGWCSGFHKITSPGSKVQRCQGFTSQCSRLGEGGSDTVMDNDVHETK
eukprot:2511656-Ditylum_brightwellii.AAC.1